MFKLTIKFISGNIQILNYNSKEEAENMKELFKKFYKKEIKSIKISWQNNSDCGII